MKLVIEKLLTTLEQEIRLSSNERKSVAVICPYLYMHNAPAGTFTFSILSGVTVIFSKTFTSADIKAALDNTTDSYAHVFYPIIPANPLQLEKGTYTLKLSASGYAPTVTSFLAWCKQYENLNNELDYSPSNDGENPLAFRLKEFKRN